MSILNLGKATLVGISLLSPKIQIASMFIWTPQLTVNGSGVIGQLVVPGLVEIYVSGSVPVEKGLAEDCGGSLIVVETNNVVVVGTCGYEGVDFGFGVAGSAAGNLDIKTVFHPRLL